uniref:Uncharacterized protein n=1 Tax=viral metagenome TaxID=1070528 RepID=A0A6H1ZIJ0_9ZZZZ
MAFPLIPLLTTGATLLGGWLGSRSKTNPTYSPVMSQADVGFDSAGNPMGGVSDPSTISKIWDFIKEHPEMTMLGIKMLSSIPGGMQDYTQGQTYNKLLEAQVSRLKEDEKFRKQAKEGLKRMLSVNPYSKQIPHMGDIFG